MNPTHSHSRSTFRTLGGIAALLCLLPAFQAFAAPLFPQGWQGKALVAREGDAGLEVVVDVDAGYGDSNANGRMDPDDAGWFAPGSTVKVAIALAALEAKGGRQGLESQIEKALILSDNDATNQLIDAVGGPAALTETLRARGFKRLVVGRRMMAPRGELSGCEEAPGRRGNCASALDLLRSLRAVVRGGVFDVTDADRAWLSRTLSSTPRQAGFSLPDDHCRFARRPGLQKCGVSPWAPQHWTNIAYFPDLKRYVFVGVVPPSGTPESRITEVLSAATSRALETREENLAVESPVAPADLKALLVSRGLKGCTMEQTGEAGEDGLSIRAQSGGDAWLVPFGTFPSGVDALGLSQASVGRSYSYPTTLQAGRVFVLDQSFPLGATAIRRLRLEALVLDREGPVSLQVFESHLAADGVETPQKTLTCGIEG